MSQKLNQVVAIEKDVKNNTHQELTAAHHVLLKPELLSGLTRTYQPKDEEGEPQPNEVAKVQVRAEDVIVQTSKLLSGYFDVTATKDYGNCLAKTSVEVDGKELLKDVPITYLLFLEKQLTDLHTFVKKLPVLDPAQEWKWDPGQELFVTNPNQTYRTKKVPRNHVKAEATDKHQAVVEVYHEDVTVGTYTTTKQSGALTSKRVRELTDRVEKLQKAVKFAREQANTIQVDSVTVGKPLFDYLFSK